MTKTRYHKGLWAEEKALDYLRAKGWELVQQRARTPYGEIDLLMLDGPTLVAVEVKYRPDLDTCAVALTSRQQRRIAEGLLYAASLQPQPFALLRCDVILLSDIDQIVHYENAWQIEDF